MSGLPSGETLPESLSKSEMKVKGLPDGWKREVVVRKNGQSAGKTDVYYYSPCGKKFRSKPQIARFLGSSVDLTVFDFSRGTISGGVSSQRRARDRGTSRRGMESGRVLPALIKPLTISPLGASGPIRRTCGVIKLPVTWIPTPTVLVVVKDETEPMDTSDSTSGPPPLLPSSSAPDSTESPLPVPADSSRNVDTSLSQEPTTAKPPQPPPLPVPTPAPAAAEENRSTPSSSSSSSTAAPSTSTNSTSSSSSQHIFPSLWENRLRGFVVHDHETKTEIKVDLERLQNGSAHPSNNETNSIDKTALPGGVKMAVCKRGDSGEVKATSSAIQLPTSSLLNNLLGKQHTTTAATLPPKMKIGNIVPSLLAHGIKAHQQQNQSGGGQSHGAAAAFLSAAVKSRKENGNLGKAINTSSAITSQHQNRANLSSGNIIFTLPAITQGAIKMIKQVTASSGAEIKVASTTATTAQKQTMRTAGPVIAAAKTTHGGGSGVRPTSGTSADSNKQLFVSESELVLQEERVRQLREKLMAAQSAV